MPRIPLNVAATLPRTLGPPPKALPSDFSPTAADARSLYRSLWRVGSLSIMYSNPGHKVIREKIREAFEESRKNPAKTPQDIKEQWERGKQSFNTRFFFEIASTRFGVEHRVISNMCVVTAEKNKGTTRSLKPAVIQNQKEVEREYTKVIHALNESMRLSLR
ncbi:hypothetical protein MVEG_01581 [Podila verticillata NRRL 6337]|nr:hypothetical protein MVEG_01581 [Podila verticillata NRRL 6337]